MSLISQGVLPSGLVVWACFFGVWGLGLGTLFKDGLMLERQASMVPLNTPPAELPADQRSRTKAEEDPSQPGD